MNDPHVILPHVPGWLNRGGNEVPVIHVKLKSPLLHKERRAFPWAFPPVSIIYGLVQVFQGDTVEVAELTVFVITEAG